MRMARRRVILTGATGFIGRHAIAPLLERGFEVHVLARNPPAALPGVVPHAVDLMDSPATARTVAAIRATHLLHVAWFVEHGRFWTAPENLDWVAASLRLYRAFAAAGGQRLLGTGSCAEYDWSSGQVTGGPATPIGPATLYGTAKDALHNLLRAASAIDGVSLAWGRLFFLYGPHEPKQRLIPSVMRAVLQSRPAPIGDGLARRDFLHVADAARALVTALDAELEGAFDIATGTALPLIEVAAEAARQAGDVSLLLPGTRPTPASEPSLLCGWPEPLARIGFRPRFDLMSGLADAAAFWRLQVGASPCPGA